jgi:penicillin-binding protein 1A
MKDATVAIEDKDFYHEGAFNVRGIARAAVHDVFSSGGGEQGASTITEQLVKLNEQWIGNRTVGTKIKEVILAVEMGREYSKDQILTGYLNVAPYGGVEYGVQSAAEDYFHTSAADLTLPQAAMLAAIPQYPSGYSPYSDPAYNPSAEANYFDQSGLLGREQYILNQMASQGYITKDQAAAAIKVNVLAEVQPLQTKFQNIKAPYFVLAAKQELENKYGSQTVDRGGWKVTTTLNLGLQSDAEKIAAANLPNVEANGGDEEAMVGEQVQTGKIVMEVGGVNFSNPSYGQINYAQTNISPGSSIKPAEYALLINTSTDAGAGSVLYDSKGAIPGYSGTCPYNPYAAGESACPAGTEPYLYDDNDFFPGPLTLRYALAASRNVPAVKVNLIVGTTNAVNNVDAMMGDSDGYKCYADGTNVFSATKADETTCYASSGIGDGAYLHLDEEANMDSTLARLGQEIPETYINEITDANGKVVYQWTQPKPKQVLRTDAAYIVDNMLYDPRATYLPGSCTSYTCTPLSEGGYKWERYNGWNISVKTGTTNNEFDGLMTAWTTQYAITTWVGYHTRNVAMTAGQMEYMTEPLARNWMQDALNSLHEAPVNWKQPSDIKTEAAYVDEVSPGYGTEVPSSSTDIYPSWYIAPKGGGDTTAVIDKVSDRLATSCTPADAKETITASNASTFSIDPYVTGGVSSAYNTTASDNVHSCSDAMPTATLTVTSNDNSTNGGTPVCDKTSGCTVTATVTKGTWPLASSKFPGTVSITINGKVAKTFSITGTASPQTFSYSYTPTSSGSVTIVASVTDSVLYQAQSNSEVIENSTTTSTGTGNSPGNAQGNSGGPQ